MNPRVLYHIARADFLERVRRYSFLVTLGFTLYAAFEANRGNIVVNVGNYRGVYNSAWLGLLLSLTATTLITMVGFYVIKNTVERDRHTGVGQILASTPLGKVSYLTGKALSNFAVVGVMAAILMCAAFVMQLWRAEAAGVDLWKLISPFLLMTLPALAFLSALAVLFECVPGLRGGFGNIFYFFFWTAMLTAGIKLNNRYLDLLGMDVVQTSVVARATQVLPADYKGGFSFQIGPHERAQFQTFVWDGIQWTAAVIVPRLSWFFIAFLTVLLAAVFFDRFDPSRSVLQRVGLGRGRLSPRQPSEKPSLKEVPEGPASAEALAAAPAAVTVHLTPLAERAGGYRMGAVLAAELRLMLQGRSKWWYLVALGLFIATLFTPAGEPLGKVLAFAWLWPALVWSAMGTREARNATGPLIFSSARALGRQLPAVWLAGVCVCLLTGGGAGVRFLIARDWTHLLAWGTGAMFIPAMALALGVWSGTSKLFEGLYTAFWYAGPVQPTPGLDFMGASPVVSVRVPLYYLAATAGLLVVAAVGRRRQIRR
jgi:hypothetical protein